MAATNNNSSTVRRRISQIFARIWEPVSGAPLLGWLLGALVAVILEQLIGLSLANMLGMRRIPALFGIVIVLQKPSLIPSVILYDLLIYILPTYIIVWLSTPFANWSAAKLLNFNKWVAVLVHIVLIYAVLHIWCDVSDYRLLVVRLILVAIIITASLNVINGYMGEFSCSHPGFIALGAYMASVVTVGLFVDDNFYGPAYYHQPLGTFYFPSY